MFEESSKIELKEKLNDKLEKEVCAFLNNHEGGIIYIGISDDGNVVGIEEADLFQKKIAERIKDNILPTTLGLYDVVLEEIEDKRIVKIIVSSGLEKPYYLKDKGMSPLGCFIRVGTTVQQMTQAMIDNLYSKRLHNHTLKNIPSPRQNLTFTQLKIYYEGNGIYLNDKFAENLELYTQDGKYNYLAYLLADENGISIKVAKYLGTDKIDLIENYEYGYCCLIKATYRVLEKFEIENRTYAMITGKERIERRIVKRIPLREIIINAIVHNDYTRGLTPVFEIYSDRIEISSDGGLVYGQTEEDFFSCVSVPRNRELMRIFRDVDIVEQLGIGMNRILREYDRSIFQIFPRRIKVVLPFDLSLKGERQEDIVNQFNLNSTQRIIIKLILENPDITMAELSNRTSKSLAAIKLNLAKLREEKIIERVGSDRSGYWKVNTR